MEINCYLLLIDRVLASLVQRRSQEGVFERGMLRGWWLLVCFLVWGTTLLRGVIRSGLACHFGLNIACICLSKEPILVASILGDFYPREADWVSVIVMVKQEDDAPDGDDATCSRSHGTKVAESATDKDGPRILSRIRIIHLRTLMT